MARTAELESRVATLTGPSAKAVSLTGQGETAGARAQAFLDLEGRVLLYVYDLPPLPPGQTYQLWVIVEGTPIMQGRSTSPQMERRAMTPSQSRRSARTSRS